MNTDCHGAASEHSANARLETNYGLQDCALPGRHCATRHHPTAHCMEWPACPTHVPGIDPMHAVGRRGRLAELFPVWRQAAPTRAGRACWNRPTRPASCIFSLVPTERRCSTSEREAISRACEADRHVRSGSVGLGHGLAHTPGRVGSGGSRARGYTPTRARTLGVLLHAGRMRDA